MARQSRREFGRQESDRVGKKLESQAPGSSPGNRTEGGNHYRDGGFLRCRNLGRRRSPGRPWRVLSDRARTQNEFRRIDFRVGPHVGNHWPRRESGYTFCTEIYRNVLGCPRPISCSRTVSPGPCVHYRALSTLNRPLIRWWISITAIL